MTSRTDFSRFLTLPKKMSLQLLWSERLDSFETNFMFFLLHSCSANASYLLLQNFSRRFQNCVIHQNQTSASGVIIIKSSVSCRQSILSLPNLIVCHGVVGMKETIFWFPKYSIEFLTHGIITDQLTSIHWPRRWREIAQNTGLFGEIGHPIKALVNGKYNVQFLYKSYND